MIIRKGKIGVQALTIVTVSDHLVTGEAATGEERQTMFMQMMNIVLELTK
ncbi:hypothetical protein [Propionispora vibrioides]|uniref:Purine-nucleoside phosphorylase n=1 Tax=Propionispora vibrioides TaxID=112903 RepID=A0A1H8VZT0_9FIRM|nr:purine-nucleoside phosphorylase [Propionispora vibrioides]